MRLRGITLPGTGYPKLSDFSAPVMKLPYAGNLIGAYFVGNGAGNRLANYANSSKPLTEIGTPYARTNFSRCDKNNCYDTGIIPTDKMTIFVVARANQTELSSLAVSNYNSVDGDGIDISIQRLSAYGRVGTSSGQIIQGAVNANISALGGRNFISGLASWGGVGISVAAYNNPATDLIQASSVYPTRYIAQRSLLIGGNYSPASLTGEVDVSCVLIYNENVSPANQRFILAYLNNTFAPQWGL